MRGGHGGELNGVETVRGESRLIRSLGGHSPAEREVWDGDVRTLGVWGKWPEKSAAARTLFHDEIKQLTVRGTGRS